MPPPMPEILAEPATAMSHHDDLHQASMFNVRSTLIAFVVAFAGIGGYLLFHSFASSVSNELNLVKAFQNLNKHRPSGISSTATIGWSKTKLFGTAAISTTTSIDQYGDTDSAGSLTVSTPDVLPSSTPIKPKAFPYEVRTFGGAGAAFKVSNSAQFASILPHGSSLRNWITNNPTALSRLDNNWYYEYSDGQDANKAPNSTDLGCLDNTALLPSSDQFNSFGTAYNLHKALMITTQKSGASTIYTVTPNGNNGNAFVRAIANSDYVSGIDHCAQLISHSKTSDKLVGALGHTSPVVTVTVGGGNKITAITFSSNQGSTLSSNKTKV